MKARPQNKSREKAAGKLLAPNGKPSNLTPEQYRLVRTPEFKAWFGDWENDPQNASKVVDENGEPKVMYHGTNVEFYEFKPMQGIRGGFAGNRGVKASAFFFTDNLDFATKAGSIRVENFKGKRKILSVFINSKDILNLSEYTYKSEEDFKSITGYYPHDYFGYVDNLDQWWRIIDEPELVDKIKAAGYDCVFLAETTLNETKYDLQSIAVFNSNQIKLADGTNTTFDGCNPDIRYAAGGMTDDELNTGIGVINNMEIDALAGSAFKEGGELDDDQKETYQKWKKLVNMSRSELESFYNSEEGKVAGLTPAQAKDAGIDSGRESARWVMKMKSTPVKNWTPSMWKWANKQISFVSRMTGNKGKLYDENGNKTRKHLSLLIWGNNPEKKSAGDLLPSKNILNIMDNFKYSQLPKISELGIGKTIVLKEEVFGGNADNPKHLGKRFIVAEIVGLGGMKGTVRIKVKESAGANPLHKNMVIERPVSNIMKRGREYEQTVAAKKDGDFKEGGELNPDNKEVKQYFAHKSGDAGGVLVGKRHSEGGIQAVNNGTGQNLEMEGGEVVITRDAVSDTTLREFEGKKMTNREILSAINQSGGGVAFSDGGKVENDCGCA